MHHVYIPARFIVRPLAVALIRLGKLPYADAFLRRCASLGANVGERVLKHAD
jgi:hypothetical protein